MTISAVIVIFILGYIAIAMEHKIKIDIHINHPGTIVQRIMTNAFMV
jgi:hypothetical protein